MKLTNQSFLRLKNQLSHFNWFDAVFLNNATSIRVYNKKYNRLVVSVEDFKTTKDMISYITRQLAYTELTLIHGEAWMSRRSKADLKLIINREAA